MADVATFGLRLDAGSYLATSKQVVAENERLKASGRAVGATYSQLSTTDLRAAAQRFDIMTLTQEKLNAAHAEAIKMNAALGRGMQSMAGHAHGGTQSLSGLQRSMAMVAAQATGLGHGAGMLASSLGSLALESGPMIGVLAGIAAVGYGWQKVSEDMEETRRANEKLLAALVAGEGKFKEHAARIRIASLEARRDQLRDEAAMTPRERAIAGAAPLSVFGAMFREGFEIADPLTKDVQAIEQRLADLRRSLVEGARAAQHELGEKMADALKKDYAEADRLAKKLDEIVAKIGFVGVGSVNITGRAFGPLRPGTSGTFTMPGMGAGGMPGLKVADLEGSLARTAIAIGRFTEDVKQDERDLQMAEGAIIGTFGSVLRQMGGPLAGAATGLIDAIAAGAEGPLPLATAAVSGLMDALMGGGEAAGQQREQQEQLQRTLEGVNDELAVAQGRMTDYEAQIAAVHREFDAQKQPIEDWIASAAKIGITSTTVQGYLDTLNETERARIETILEQVRVYNEQAQQDLEVRRLRALGLTDEADALELAIKQQREYADAVKQGADATTLAALSEVQRLERIQAAMDKTQQRIDALTSTIAGLAGFRDSLLLSDTKSPTDRYAEAKRQYEAIAAAAAGGDQAAAGRLPGIAQTFLDASRAVNASGTGFQTDFQRVLQDTQDAINKFTDLKTIEELMLDELKAIRDNTNRIPINEGPPSGGGTPGTPSNPTGLTPEAVEEQTDALKATVTALTSGFQELSAKMDTVAASVDNGTFRNEYWFQSLIADSKNRLPS